MQWDLGPQGFGLLVLMSLGFGLAAHLVAWRSVPRWTWLAAAGTYLVSGVLISEAWFGWATEQDLQPNVDGLSFDEVLLIGLIPLIATVLVLRAVTRRRHPAAPRHTTHRTRPHATSHR